jgi:predicted O-linked N-acetylglucosamine transferase (SPINDLY family)
MYGKSGACMVRNDKTLVGKSGKARNRAKHVPDAIKQQTALARKHVASGNLVQAAEVYRKAISDYTDSDSCYFELAGVYWRQGLLKEAESAYRSALKLNPGNADIYCNLGIIVWKLSGWRDAASYFSEAVGLNPRHIHAMYNLGGMLLQEGECEEAVHWFAKILEIEPGHADAWMYKGNAHFEMGEYDLAMTCYSKHAKLKPSGGALIRLAAAIPMIPESVGHISAIRDSFMNRLQDLIDAGIKVADPVGENGYTNFFLAYHGLDDLPLQRKYAELYEKACPSLIYESKHCRSLAAGNTNHRIRVGFISKYFRGHSIGKTSCGVIKQLDRQKFEVVVIFVGPPGDQTAHAIAEAADKVLVLQNDLANARRLVGEMQLDILFYQDIGMDPFTYFLAFSRLAPVQCASFGHPVTTGIRNIDYYISTDLWEPDGADAHYSEVLVRLKNVASVAYYYRPVFPAYHRSRSYFGLPENSHLYICPQTLFKFHPDFDEIMAGVLRQDADGVVVLIEGRHKTWGRILRRRFESAIPDVAHRIRFVARQNGAEYLNLLRVSDVMLDTMHFCGFNTSLEGFSAGLPVVTMPGSYMRSRHTAAFYRKMNYLECIAENLEQYIELAIRLGKDDQYREKVVSEIENRLHVLWEEGEVISEFEEFFQFAYRKKKTVASI